MTKSITQMRTFFLKGPQPQENRIFNVLRFLSSHAFLKHLSVEILGNCRRIWEVLKNCKARNVLTLIIVKLMDYSDHLPQNISAFPLLISSKNDLFEYLTTEHILKLNHLCTHSMNWALNSGTQLEISYNASLGSAEVHPHILQVFIRHRGNQQLIHFRYFDDESTVWQGNPCRASTITVAELVIDAGQKKLDSFRYFRYRSSKRKMLDLRKSLADLNQMLDSSKPLLNLDLQRITFGLEICAKWSHLICRYAVYPKTIFRSLFTSCLVRSQLSIVTAIMKENVTFTKLALSKLSEVPNLNTNESFSSQKVGALKMSYGKKQLRVRLR